MVEFDSLEYAYHLIQKTYGLTDKQLNRVPFRRFYCYYQCCVFDEMKVSRERRWAGAWLSYQLSGMFCSSEEEPDWEEYGSRLGVLPQLKRINKDEQIEKAKKVEELIRGKFKDSRLGNISPKSTRIEVIGSE